MEEYRRQLVLASNAVLRARWATGARDVDKALDEALAAICEAARILNRRK